MMKENNTTEVAQSDNQTEKTQKDKRNEIICVALIFAAIAVYLIFFFSSPQPEAEVGTEAGVAATPTQTVSLDQLAAAAAKQYDEEMEALKKSNYDEYIKKIEGSIFEPEVEELLVLAEYYLQKESSKGYYYLHRAAAKGSKDAEYELAVCRLIFGSEYDKKEAHKMISDLADADNIGTEYGNGAIARHYMYSLFCDVNAEKKWPVDDVFHRRTWLNTMSKTAEDQCVFGLQFLENFVRLNYSKEAADAILAKFDAVVKEADLDRTKLADLAYNGICKKLAVPGTGYQVKDFDIDFLLNRDMPLKEWGIYWLKNSSSQGCKTAGKLLAVMAEYNK